MDNDYLPVNIVQRVESTPLICNDNVTIFPKGYVECNVMGIFSDDDISSIPLMIINGYLPVDNKFPSAH